MKALKAYFFTSLTHFIRIAVILLITKLIAVELGPKGLGFLGNYMTLNSAIFTLAGGGVLAGVISFVSRNRKEDQVVDDFMQSSLIYGFIFNLILCLVYVLFRQSIQMIIFGESTYEWALIGLLAAQFLFGISNLVTGYLNGQGLIKSYSAMMIVGYVLAMPLSYYSIKSGGIVGSCVALLLPNLLIFVPALYFSFKFKIVSKIKTHVNGDHFKYLGRFTVMALLSTVLFPSSEILVRRLIIEKVGLYESGLFQGLWRISAVYISFMTTFLSFYFLPQISALTDEALVSKSVKKTLKLVWGIFFLGMILFYFTQDMVIRFVLSEEFMSIKPYIIYQVTGDLIKLTGYVFGFFILSRADLKKYFIIELVQGGAFWGYSYFFLSQKAELSSFYRAHIMAATTYLVTVYVLYRLSRKNNMNLIRGTV